MVIDLPVVPSALTGRFVLITGRAADGKTSMAALLAGTLQKEYGSKVFWWEVDGDVAHRVDEFSRHHGLDQDQMAVYGYLARVPATPLERAKTFAQILESYPVIVVDNIRSSRWWQAYATGYDLEAVEVLKRAIQEYNGTVIFTLQTNRGGVYDFSQPPIWLRETADLWLKVKRNKDRIETEIAKQKP